jgi:hypothetical protein
MSGRSVGTACIAVHTCILAAMTAIARLDSRRIRGRHRIEHALRNLARTRQGRRACLHASVQVIHALSCRRRIGRA